MPDLGFQARSHDGSIVSQAETLDAAVAGACAYFIATRLAVSVSDIVTDEVCFSVGIDPPAAVAPEEEPETEEPVVEEHPAEVKA